MTNLAHALRVENESTDTDNSTALYAEQRFAHTTLTFKELPPIRAANLYAHAYSLEPDDWMSEHLYGEEYKAIQRAVANLAIERKQMTVALAIEEAERKVSLGSLAMQRYATICFILLSIALFATLGITSNPVYFIFLAITLVYGVVYASGLLILNTISSD